MKKKRRRSLNCHEGNVLVATLEEPTIRIWGGGELRGAEPIEGGLTLDLAGFFETRPPFKVGGWKAPCLERYLRNWHKVVTFDWIDGSVPRLGRYFWQCLLDDIERLAEKEGGLDLLIMCQGGHGRTGTALAIICCLWGLIPEERDPVEWVREKYCERAVETECQIDYIEKVTYRKVRAEASEKPFFKEDWKEWRVF